MSLRSKRDDIEDFYYKLGIQIGKRIYAEANEEQRIELVRAAFNFFIQESITPDEVAVRLAEAWIGEREERSPTFVCSKCGYQSYEVLDLTSPNFSYELIHKCEK